MLPGSTHSSQSCEPILHLMLISSKGYSLACRMVDEAFTTFPAAFLCAMPAPPMQATPTTHLTTDNPAGLEPQTLSNIMCQCFLIP